jgi:hypothetical protein
VELLLCGAEVSNNRMEIDLIDRAFSHWRLDEKIEQPGLARVKPGQQETASAKRCQHGLDNAGSTERCQGSIKRIAAGLEDQCCSFRRFRVSRGYSAFHHPIDRYHLPQTVREYNKTGSHAFSCGYKGLCKEGSSGSFPVISSERCYV